MQLMALMYLLILKKGKLLHCKSTPHHGKFQTQTKQQICFHLCLKTLLKKAHTSLSMSMN